MLRHLLCVQKIPNVYLELLDDGVTIMQTRLLEHLNDNNILVKEQYGFRINQKTDNAVYYLTNEILNALNNNLFVGGVFCDLEKAFDCVNHKFYYLSLSFMV